MGTHLEGGRIGLAMLAVGGLVVAMVAVFSGAPAQGVGNPPSVECASESWNGEYWKVQVNDGDLAGVETNIEDDAIYPISLVEGTVTWTNNSDDPVFRIVRKSGQTISADLEGLWGPGSSHSFSVPEDISHITYCFTEVQDTTTTTESTTTTTEPTTTTSEPTTTTTESTTTTTEPTTTTTEPTTTTTESTTTTTEPTTTTSEPTTTTTESTTTTTEPTTTTTEGTTTTTDDDDDDDDNGTTTTTQATTTTPPTTEPPDEVLGTEVTGTDEVQTDETLPFTGIESEPSALLALTLVAAGAAALVAARTVTGRTEE